MHNCINLLYTWNEHKVVHQLHFKKKIFKNTVILKWTTLSLFLFQIQKIYILFQLVALSNSFLLNNLIVKNIMFIYPEMFHWAFRFSEKKKRPYFVTRVNLSKSEFIIDILFKYSSLPSNLIYIPQIIVFEESV